MFERMLDKNKIPSIEEMKAYCGANGDLLQEVNDYLIEELGTQTEIRFPYGNKYGWSITHRKKKKLICDIFAESGAFTVMLRLSNKQFEAIYGEMLSYTQNYIDNKYPCGDGGWIHYRILCKEHLDDIEKLLEIKIGRNLIA